MENTFVVTINRQFGSGGRVIAEGLAKNLKVSYLDKKILEESATKLGLQSKHLKGYDEKAPSIWATPMVEVGNFSVLGIPHYLHSSTNDELYIMQTKLIKEQTEKASCVILGRTANYILKDHPRSISIYLYADKEFKLDIIHNVYEAEAKNLEKEMKRLDKERARYYENYTGRDWKDMTQYDLTINTAKLGIQKTIQLIEDYVKIKFNAK
jgi:cytidylate kinase